jgi:DNA-binding LacI/PurR family transcriptional regulator
MAAYLWEMGHRRIACLMPQNYHVMFLPRRHGVEDFLRQHNAYDPELDICLGLPDQLDKHGHSQPEATPPDLGPTVERLFAMPEDRRPTAVIAVNDWTATGLYMAMFKQGKTIGKDLSIVGIDNAPSVYNMLNPGLTTYGMAFTGSAYVATRQLIQKVLTPSNCFHSSVQLITGDIVIRQSVADLR